MEIFSDAEYDTNIDVEHKTILYNYTKIINKSDTVYL